MRVGQTNNARFFLCGGTIVLSTSKRRRMSACNGNLSNIWTANIERF